MRWRSKEARKAAAMILPDLLKDVTLDGETLRYELRDYMPVRTAFSVLSTNLVMSDQIAEVTKDSIVSAAVRQLLTSSAPPEVDAFLKAARESQRKFLKKRPSRYVLLSRLSLDLPANFHRITRQGTLHQFTRKIPRGFERPNKAVNQERLQLPPADVSYCWVRTHVSSRDTAGAGELATDRLDEWRAIWNYSLSYGQFRTSMGGGRPFPVNPIVVGPVHTLHKTDGSVATDMYWWEPSHVERAKLMTVDGHRRLIQFDRKFRGHMQRSRAGPQISRTFIRYVRALDERDMQSAFLKLWGVLEVVTGTTLQGYDVTVHRASAVWEDRSRARAILHHLRNRRNDFIHQGREATNSETLVYTLKTYIDQLLIRVVENAHEISSLAEFGAYLDLLSDPSGLPVKRRLVSIAMKATGTR